MCVTVGPNILLWLVNLSLFCKNLTSYLQMTNTIQKKFKVSSTQLLYQSCPYQAITLFVIGPFLDGLLTNKNVFAFKYTPQVLVRIETLTRNSPTPSPKKKASSPLFVTLFSFLI